MVFAYRLEVSALEAMSVGHEPRIWAAEERPGESEQGGYRRLIGEAAFVKTTNLCRLSSWLTDLRFSSREDAVRRSVSEVGFAPRSRSRLSLLSDPIRRDRFFPQTFQPRLGGGEKRLPALARRATPAWEQFPGSCALGCAATPPGKQRASLPWWRKVRNTLIRIC